MKLDYGRYSIETSNDDKVMYPGAGTSKAAVINYYRKVADLILPQLKDRCLTLQRFPDGIGGEGFYQQSRSDYFPEFVGGKLLDRAAGGEAVEHIVVNNEAALVYLADQATLTFHGWLSRIDRPHHPDRVVFDLDPSGDDFGEVIDCARLLHDALEFAGLVPYVMTTGSRGLHVLAPLSRKLKFDEVRDFAKNVAAAVAAHAPDRFTTEQRKKARRGRLYIDIGRNAWGQTSVQAYSLRAIEGAPVATPLDWSELGRAGLSPRHYDIENLPRRIAQKPDPFTDFLRHQRRPQLGARGFEEWQPTND